mmetsp:Transcript_17770/g.30089  ORF Transcript_17770/g.30089 Transcript_17770/m.30089 type:complete len:205 (+) Transcript_17770:1281-1895(+)
MQRSIDEGRGPNSASHGQIPDEVISNLQTQLINQLDCLIRQQLANASLNCQVVEVPKNDSERVVTGKLEQSPLNFERDLMSELRRQESQRSQSKALELTKLTPQSIKFNLNSSNTIPCQKFLNSGMPFKMSATPLRKQEPTSLAHSPLLTQEGSKSWLERTPQRQQNTQNLLKTLQLSLERMIESKTDELKASLAQKSSESLNI